MNIAWRRLESLTLSRRLSRCWAGRGVRRRRCSPAHVFVCYRGRAGVAQSRQCYSPRAGTRSAAARWAGLLGSRVWDFTIEFDFRSPRLVATPHPGILISDSVRVP
eukprot:2980106-Prymnesium_polylepis.1